MHSIKIEDITLINLAILTKKMGFDTISETINFLVRKELDDFETDEVLNNINFEVTHEPLEHKNISPEKVIYIGGTKIVENKLLFTKVLSAVVAGKKVKNPNWHKVLIEVFSVLSNKYGVKGQPLGKYISIPNLDTRFLENGYKFYTELGLSIQGQTATNSCQEICRICKYHDIQLLIEFKWDDDKERAHHPGKIGRIEFPQKHLRRN